MAGLVNVSEGVEVASRVTLCETGRARTRGLLGTTRLDPGHVYWIRPCHAIHTFFMTMAIDVAFLDDDLRVLKVVPSMTPFRVCVPVRGAASVLEGAEGMISSGRLRKGVVLKETNEPVSENAEA